jgi:hypothetical protein
VQQARFAVRAAIAGRLSVGTQRFDEIAHLLVAMRDYRLTTPAGQPIRMRPPPTCALLLRYRSDVV